MTQFLYFPLNHISLFSILSDFISWQPLGIKKYVHGRSLGGQKWTVAPQFTKQNNTNKNASVCSWMGEAELLWNRLGSEWWTERTIIDYYIKQEEIVSVLEGRKVINSEGPVIRENDITSVVCFGLQFKRKNWKRIWCGVKGVGLTARGSGLCCCFACLLVSVYVLVCESHSPALTFFPSSSKETM